MFRKLVITLLSGALCLLVANSVLAAKYNEAPMLRVKVAAGELPPVEERLPEVPGRCLDVLPENLDLEIGLYGGTLRTLSIDAGSMGHDTGWFAREYLVQAPGFYYWPTEVVGDVLEDFEISDDQKVFTFYMRKGMKWSDGYPFTTEDVRFWYEDVLQNGEITPIIPVQARTQSKSAGKLMELKIIDEYTFQLSFDEPYGAFLTWWSCAFGAFPPAHYAKRFHSSYTPIEKLEPLIKEEGFEKGEWGRLYLKMTSTPSSGWPADLPVLFPWVQTGVTPTKFKFERNPYYWKVDAAGNQLPYIDRVETTVTSTQEAGTMKILAGEIDLARRAANLQNLPLYKEYQEAAGLEVRLLKMHAALAEVFLNLTNADPVWREVVGDVRFRRALSFSIDREQIIDALYYNLAELPEAIALNEYKPAEANRLLDEMGMDKRDNDGWRLGPDGKKFTIPFEISRFTGEEAPTAEIVRQFFQDVGIYTTLRNLENALWLAKAAANEMKAFIWWAHYTRWPFDEPGHLGQAWQTTYAPLWFQWYLTNGAEGEEPPAVYIKYRKLYEEMLATLDGEVHEKNWNEMRRILAEEVWILPIINHALNPLLFKTDLGNVANVAETGYQHQSAIAAEQFFWKE